jgi:hypothetical protein
MPRALSAPSQAVLWLLKRAAVGTDWPLNSHFEAPLASYYEIYQMIQAEMALEDSRGMKIALPCKASAIVREAPVWEVEPQGKRSG